MRTRKCLLTWFLTMALILMQLPLQAAIYNGGVPIRNQDGYDFLLLSSDKQNGWNGLQIGEYCHVKVGQRIRPHYGQWGHTNMSYYTTPSGIILDEKMDELPNAGLKARTMLPKKPTELHMAYDTDMEWCIERIGVTTASMYRSEISDYSIVFIENYKVYPKINYYGVNYNLDAGSWKESTDWIESNAGKDYGIWKATQEQKDEAGNLYAGNIWFAYDNFGVVLPTDEEVNKEGCDLAGWEIGGSMLNPGAAYKLAKQDAQFDADGQHTISVKAVWVRKNVTKPVISNITANTANAAATYKAGAALTGYGFEYKKSVDSEWTLVTTNVDADSLTADLSGLQENTEYQIKAYIATSTGKVESEIASFKTNRQQRVNKAEVSNISTSGASISAGYVSEDALTGQGFKYKKKADVSSTWLEAAATADGSKLTGALANLASGTVYEVKAFIKTDQEETVGESIVFTTKSSSSTGDSGSGGAATTTPAVTPTTPAEVNPVSTEAIKKAEEAIQKLTETEKQEIAQEIKEDLPYTLPVGGLTVEQLKALTKNKLTEAELQTIAKKPELLKALGIDTTTLAATVALKPIENPEFKDVASSHWAADTIKEAARLGIATGREDGSFAPSAPLQMADTFTFLDRVLLRHDITASTLPRSTVEKYVTDKDHWAFNNMASIGSKLSEDTLKTISQQGDKPLTRDLLAQSLYEITKGKLKAVKAVPAFTDTQSSPYQEAINYCVAAGLLNGTSNNTMSPQKELTRAELMTILIRLDKMLK